MADIYVCEHEENESVHASVFLTIHLRKNYVARVGQNTQEF